jgi:hypothetical protein
MPQMGHKEINGMIDSFHLPENSGCSMPIACRIYGSNANILANSVEIIIACYRIKRFTLVGKDERIPGVYSCSLTEV